MSTIKQVSFREAQKILSENGFELCRKNGDHYIYKRNGINCVINPNLNKMVWLRLCKEHGLPIQ